MHLQARSCTALCRSAEAMLPSKCPTIKSVQCNACAMRHEHASCMMRIPVPACGDRARAARAGAGCTAPSFRQDVTCSPSSLSLCLARTLQRSAPHDMAGGPSASGFARHVQGWGLRSGLAVYQPRVLRLMLQCSHQTQLHPAGHGRSCLPDAPLEMIMRRRVGHMMARLFVFALR